MAVALMMLVAAVQAADPPPAPPVPPAPPPMDGPNAGAPSRAQLERRLHEAQEQLDRAAQQVAELSLSLSDEIAPMAARHGFGGSRAVLGINIGPMGHGHGRPDDTEGVRVVSVSPGGPADTAGLRAGDLIVSFAGASLTGSGGSSSSQQRLLAALHDATPGQPVAIGYRRDGKLSSAQIVPKSLDESLADLRLDMPELEALHDMPPLPDLQGFAHVRPLPMGLHEPSAFGSAELVELSPRLGQYFGVDKGLLVVRAPRDERLKLQDGDVIIDIDGRVPNGVGHAFQILSSYRAGEALKLHVMRQQKRIELPIDVPDAPDRPPT